MPSDVVLVGLREGLSSWGLRQGGVALAAGSLHWSGVFLGEPAIRELRWSTPMNETEGHSGLDWGEGMAREFCSDTSGLIRIRIRRALSRAGRQKPLHRLEFQRVDIKAKGSYTAGKLRGGVLYGSAHIPLD